MSKKKSIGNDGSDVGSPKSEEGNLSADNPEEIKNNSKPRTKSEIENHNGSTPSPKPASREKALERIFS